jgi:branched-chain amino acid aminotransferase
VIHLAQEWNIKVLERMISIDEIFKASTERKLKEAFGSGTAAVISPVGEIHHNKKRIVINKGKIGPLSQRLYDEITKVQYGEKADPYGWCYLI